MTMMINANKCNALYVTGFKGSAADVPLAATAE